LRVLIPERHEHPLQIVEAALDHAGIRAHSSISSATLEDVFVAVTMGPEERAA
jgi:hypothetical protein